MVRNSSSPPGKKRLYSCCGGTGMNLFFTIRSRYSSKSMVFLRSGTVDGDAAILRRSVLAARRHSKIGNRVIVEAGERGVPLGLQGVAAHRLARSSGDPPQHASPH